MTDLESRYGAPRPGVRLVALSLVAALGLSSIGYLGWAVLFQSTPEVQSRLLSFEVLSEHDARAELNVRRADEGTQATCHFVAYAEDHTTVGELDLRVFDGPLLQTKVVTLRTDRRATSIDLLGCTSPGQARSR